MSLKKKVNFLNEEISFAKSERRKKDVQLITKNKEIEEFLSDIKTSRDLNPVNVDKLKEINAISKYKQEYNKLKNILDDLKSKVKTTEINIKNSRPYNAKQFNLGLENKLKTLISEYNILHKNNTDMNTQLEEMENLPVILSENHKIIEKLKEKIDIQEKNVADLKNKIMLINEKKNYNETILDRQKIKNINLNLKNHYLENAIENRKQIVELKAKYTNKIKKLKEKKDELEDKYKNQERLIKSIKREIKLYEDNKKAVHPL
jgi:chromosome segregation ATPase